MRVSVARSGSEFQRDSQVPEPESAGPRTVSRWQRTLPEDLICTAENYSEPHHFRKPGR